jgi:DNA replication initiation complex subunit (GINS family)
MLEQLLNLRYRKILKTITRIRKSPTELLATEEAKICEGFVSFSSMYQQFSKNLIEGRQSPVTVTALQTKPGTTSSEGQKTEYKSPVHVNLKKLTLRFNKAIPAIMGADMKSYGPFQPEDVASLPALNAQILIKQGLAVLIDVA